MALQKFTGGMSLSDEARACYEDWYHQHFKGFELLINRELLGGFFNRLPDYCFKIAMLYAISVEQSMSISGAAMSRAIALADYFRDHIKELIGELQFTEEGKNKRKVFNAICNHFLRNGRPMEYSHLLRNAHVGDAKKLKETLAVLIDEGKIVQEADGRYWPIEYYGKFAQACESVTPTEAKS